MKTSKKIISFILCVLMVFGTFAGVDITSLFDIESSAAVTLGGITQQRVVSNYESVYAAYQQRFFTGKNSNSPTNFVIPGLSSDNNYTPQGMTYWEAKEWILISAYDASSSGKHSVIYAIDAVSTEFVALFKILNADGSINTSHGGGIAASEYNFYYADTASKISYMPLSMLDVPVGTVKEVKLQGSMDCSGELGGAATSYCCYEDGVLWTGNFYIDSDDRYDTKAHNDSQSMIVGYRLHGNSSAEEWQYLTKGYNRVILNTYNDSESKQTWNNGAGSTMEYTTSTVGGGKIMIAGKINAAAAIGEITPTFATVNLTEGKKYKIEFIADNNRSDMYMFSPVGTHCNVKQSQYSKITPLADGRYLYTMVFTAGLRPTGADSSWPTSQSKDGSYSGNYSIRFDQDSVPAGESSFVIKDFAIMEYYESAFEVDRAYEGRGVAGNPTYIIMFPGIDKIQYSMVYKGRIYISRSWSRTESDNHSRELVIGELDISAPGTHKFVVNGKTRNCYLLDIDDTNNMTRFGGDKSSSNKDKMFYMSEALCVMNDYLYMFAESAAWNYYGDGSTGGDGKASCPQPIDVIWKIDQHAIMNESRYAEDVALSHYEKVNSLDQIDPEEDYLFVYESELKDPVTQKNIIYAMDAFGGYGDSKLPKNNSGTQANTGDSMGIVGYPITTYTKDDTGNILYLNDEDDANRSIRWRISGATSGNLRISNTDLYYSKYKSLYFGSRLIYMRPDTNSALNNLKLIADGSGNFKLYYDGDADYYLWCNDGSNQSYISAYTNYYSNHGKVGYAPAYNGLEEQPGTFHADRSAVKDAANSGNLMGGAVDEKYEKFQIYKRVEDKYADTYDTRVYTDLNAEIQPDGTYKIDIETYAIGSTQYQILDKERPTDFIFVLDASGSMTNYQDAKGYHADRNWSHLKMIQAAGNNNDIAENSDYNREYTSNFYYKLPDGQFARISVAVNKGSDGTYSRDIWLWCKHPVTGRCYKLSQNGYLVVNNCTGNPSTDSSSRLTDVMFLSNPSGYGYASASEILSEASSDKNRTDYHSSRNSKDKRKDYEVLHHTYTDEFGNVRNTYYNAYGDSSRLCAMQQAVEQLTFKIEDMSKQTNLDHRIALVTYGSNGDESWLNTGMYTNGKFNQYNGSLSSSVYKNAFYSISNFVAFRSALYGMNTQINDPDTYSNYGFDMANQIIANETAGRYLADGDRSVCIVMITDGIPGIGNNNASVATSTANSAIANAYQSKNNGAYVYSVQMGSDSCDGFSMNDYMDFVSSEYIFAESMTNPGDRNVKDIEYRINVPTGSDFNITNLVNDMFNSIQSNSKNALAKLDAKSILQAQITDAFDLSKAECTVNYAKPKYDGLDRLGFETPKPTSEAEATFDKSTGLVTVTGYDYSKRYIATSNNDAQKLVVSFTGVLPRMDAELVNTSINNTSTTAIYQNQTKYNEGKEFKKFPTEMFTIPEYTYILDYGIPMLDEDVNGTLCSVDTQFRAQSTYKNKIDEVSSDINVEFSSDKQNLIYSVKPEGDGQHGDDISRGYVLIQRDDGTYDWFRINVLPASNVYFEEATLQLDRNSNYNAWNAVGTPANEYQTLTGKDDLYGYDKAYDIGGNKFSNNTYFKSEVTDTNTRSETAFFTYSGTAFDLVSACGKNTGIQIVTVKRADGSIEKVYIIDTYYDDTTYVNSDGLLCQVPILQHRNAGGYGKYTVEVTSVYLASAVSGRSSYSLRSDGDMVDFYTADISDQAVEAVLCFAEMEDLMGEDIEVVFADENSIFNGGTGAATSGAATFALGAATGGTTTLVNYLDGFRIYNPLGSMTGSYPESEQQVTYYNVMNDVADYGIGEVDNLSGIVYLTGESIENLSFAEYKTKGPKSEVYLKPNATEGIAFGFGYQPGAKVSIGMRSVDGKPVTVKVNNKTITVTSTTEMYYDISDIDFDTPGANTGLPMVTVQNVSGGLLAVNNIKLCEATVARATYAMLPRMRMMMAMPVTEEEPEASEPDIILPGGNGGSVVNPDPDLDVEGSIPDYVAPEDSDENTSASFGDIVATIKNFFTRVIEVFRKIFSMFMEV